MPFCSSVRMGIVLSLRTPQIKLYPNLQETYSREEGLGSDKATLYPTVCKDRIWSAPCASNGKKQISSLQWFVVDP